MKYIVCYHVEDEGVFIDHVSRLFDNQKSAKEYICKLNQWLAKMSECKVQDLGDYYVVIPIREANE